MSMIGSFLGTYTIFSLPDWIIYFVSAVSMVLLVGVSIFRKIGFKTHDNLSKKREYSYYTCLLFLGFIGNLFMAGSGVWYYFTNTFVLKLSTLKAK